MRTPFLLICALLCSTASAQPIEQVDQRTESVSYGPVVAIGGERWAVVAQANMEGGIPVAGQFIRAFHSDGSTAWERPVDHISWNKYPIVTMPDSGLLVGGYTYWCDVFSDLSTISRYTADGDSLWTIHISTGMPINVLSHGITTLVAAASQDSVRVLDLNGNMETSWLAPSTPVHGMHWSGDSLLFVLSGNGVYAMDPSGNVLAGSTLAGPGVDLRVRDNVVLVLRGDSLLRFSSGLDELSGAALPGPALHFVDGDDGLHIRTSNALHTAPTIDDPVQVMTISALPGLTPRGGVLRNGMLMTSGNVMLGARSSAVLRSHIGSGTAPEHDEDLEVLLSVDSTWFQFMQQSGPFMIYSQRANLTAQVVNHGSSTLQSAVLSFRFPNAIGYCGTPAHTIIDTAMALSPSDTAVFSFNSMYLNHGPSEPGATGSYIVCVVGLAPNNKVDRYPEDNTGCSIAEVVNTVGIQEDRLNATWSVFPNPFNDRFTLHLPDMAGRTVDMMLHDLTGRVVQEVRLPVSDGSVLDVAVGSLPAGMYLLRIIVDGQAWTRTMVRAGE